MGFVDDCEVVVCAVVRRLNFYAFLIVEDSLFVVLDLIIGDGKRVVEAVFFHVLVDGPLDPGNRLIYLRFVVVG